jgi:FkbM family methyltransferase
MLNRLKTSLAVAYRMRAKPRVISIDGIKISADRAFVTKDIAKALYREKHEHAERKLVTKALKPGDRVLEIGAGVGLVSLFCARICGPDAVLSYEANPALERVIRHNFALNGMEPRLRIAAAALEKGETTFYFNDNIYSSSLIDRNFGGAQIVQCDAINDVVTDFAPNTIIMDVEGAETTLLPAIDLARIDKIVVELHPWIVGQDKIDTLIAQVKASGFELRETISAAYLFVRKGA